MALIIEDTGDSHLYDPFGGRPVGVARVEGGALVDAGDFNEILFGFGGFLVETESVTVMNDGSDGEPAVVRAIGPLGRLEFAGQLLEMLVRGDFGGMRGALDYELAPGSDAVEVYLSVASDEARDVVTPMLIVAFFQRYRMPLWIEGGGFASPDGAVDMLAFTDDAGASYAWVAGEDRSLAPLIDISGVLGLNEGRATAAACSVSRFHLGSMVLGGPGLPGLQDALARRRGETLRTVTGTVTEDDGSPAAGVRVHVRRADGSHFARLTPAADGSFSVAVPNEAVSFFAFREGTALAGPVEVAAAATTADLVMPPFATLVVEVTAAGTGAAAQHPRARAGDPDGRSARRAGRSRRARPGARPRARRLHHERERGAAGGSRRAPDRRVARLRARARHADGHGGRRRDHDRRRRARARRRHRRG
ncbi:MAG: carboxypeptidase-like regulatory domain-containing protein [Sandaracinaceae bacterium]|nr:carboxypeptidase-like regulatory domain-containing protein [Sandaracinaceae bacterium]